MPVLIRYQIGRDFTEEQYFKWLEQLTWWVSSRMPNVENPKLYADKVIKAALNGTKVDGTEWVGVTKDFFKRVKQIAGFDLSLGIGVREPTKRNTISPTLTGPKTDELPPMDLKEAMKLRQDYIKELIHKYPHLDTPVYKPKVEELAETVVKSRLISNDFLTSRGQALERLGKIRESLHTQIGGLMEFLEISPKQRLTKTLEAKNADVGSMVARLEQYGESWKEFEKIDALRELLQLYKMLKSTRPDGSPQLNDWEIWHMTRNRPIHFTCRCGEEYELLGGFTPEEIEQALLQAQKVYGYGLEDIGGTQIKSGTSSTSITLDFESFDEPIQPPTEDENI